MVTTPSLMRCAPGAVCRGAHGAHRISAALIEFFNTNVAVASLCPLKRHVLRGTTPGAV